MGYIIKNGVQYSLDPNDVISMKTLKDAIEKEQDISDKVPNVETIVAQSGKVKKYPGIDDQCASLEESLRGIKLEKGDTNGVVFFTDSSGVKHTINFITKTVK